MKKTITGIYGGSFNPVHNGHMHLAHSFLAGAGLDEVWFMVSPQNPLKSSAGLLDDGIRLEMVRLALAGETKLKACDYEFRMPRPSYTWNTLRALDRDFPDREFVLLIGGDNWRHFGHWYHNEDILRNYRIVVYPRPGSDITAASLPAGVKLLDTELMDISSTQVRELARRGADISRLVPPAVAEKINRGKLYRGQEDGWL